jgi:hypothetical protein
MSGDWLGTFWTLLVSICVVIMRCTEMFWSRCKNLPTFRKNVLPSSDGAKAFLLKFGRFLTKPHNSKPYMTYLHTHTRALSFILPYVLHYLPISRICHQPYSMHLWVTPGDWITETGIFFSLLPLDSPSHDPRLEAWRRQYGVRVQRAASVRQSEWYSRSDVCLTAAVLLILSYDGQLIVLLCSMGFNP